MNYLHIQRRFSSANTFFSTMTLFLSVDCFLQSLKPYYRFSRFPDETEYEVCEDVYGNLEITHRTKEISNDSSDDDADVDFFDFFCNHKLS